MAISFGFTYGANDKLHTLSETVWVDRHGKRVAEGSHEADHLLGAKGATIPLAVAERAGLLAAPVVIAEMQPFNAAATSVAAEVTDDDVWDEPAVKAEAGPANRKDLKPKKNKQKFMRENGEAD